MHNALHDFPLRLLVAKRKCDGGIGMTRCDRIFSLDIARTERKLGSASGCRRTHHHGCILIDRATAVEQLDPNSSGCPGTAIDGEDIRRTATCLSAEGDGRHHAGIAVGANPEIGSGRRAANTGKTTSVKCRHLHIYDWCGDATGQDIYRYRAHGHIHYLQAIGDLKFSNGCSGDNAALTDRAGLV